MNTQPSFEFEPRSDLPPELDPDYVAPVESIEEASRARRPRVGEWVQGHHPVPNGDLGVRRSVEMTGLCQVLELREGDYQTGGVVVRPWRRELLSFGDSFFMPWVCVVSRVSVTSYSLTGEFHPGRNAFA